MEQKRRATASTAIADVDLTPYLPRVATAWATDAPDAMWRSFDGSLVFADVSGFTALSERLAKRGPVGAEELTEVLGQCFSGLLAVAYAEGGGLLKFGGDALLLLFDGPAHELRASRAALGMRAAIRTVGNLTTSVGRVKLRMSQGVHSGTINLFRVGGSHRELLICGPSATEVVRMEAAADAGEVVVSDATATALASFDAALVGARKEPGTLLRSRAVIHLVDGFPEPTPAGEAAAAGIPVALRAHLSAGGGESEHRHVGIAFVHFDGTDHLLEREGPDVVAAALDELVKTVQHAAEDEDVTFLATDIDKDGGKVILVAGAPRAFEDAEGRLLRVVRRVADAGTRLPLRIGVNRGHVFSGSIGPPYRKTYTVMGDAVNLSARLMAKAAPGEIVVAPSVLELSRTAFRTEALPPFTVKGKAHPVTASLLGEQMGTRERADERLPLIGRDDELGELRARAVAGGCVVEIVGDAGLGKTRLVEELREAVGGTPVRIISCEQYERTTPYFPIAVLLRHLLDVGPGGGDASRLEAAVRLLDPSLVRWVPLIGDVVGIDVDETTSTRRLQPQFRRDRTVSVVASLVDRALAGGGVVAFDDVQWIDEASTEVLRALSRAASDGRWAMVLTRRPTEGAFEADGADIVELAPLAGDDVRAIVRAASAHDPLAPDRIDEIVQRAGGNPLYAIELVRVALRSGDELPDSLEAVVGAQVDTLHPTQRRLVRYGAVLGESFEPSLFAEVVADPSLADPIELSARLDGLVVPVGDGRVQFRHRMIRDIAYAALPFRLREDLHARAAQVIERNAGDEGRERAEVLSIHCFHARQYEKCWEYSRVAGDRARDKFAVVEACAFYERALTAARSVPEVDATDTIDVLETLAIVRRLAGRHEPAREALDRARELAKGDPLTTARLCLRHGELAERTGHAGSAFRWLQRGLRLLETETNEEAARWRATLLVAAAGIRQVTGKPREALTLAARAITEAKAADNEEVLARAYALCDWSNIHLGRPEEASLTDAALELFEKAEAHENLAITLMNRGAFAYYQGRWEDALADYERSRQAFEDIGDLVDAALSDCNIAEIFTDQGHLDLAEAKLEAAIATWRGLRFPVGLALANRHLGRVALRRGDPGGALAIFDDARASLQDFGMLPKVLEVDTWRAECLLALGRVDEAARLLDECLAREVTSGATECRAMIHRLRGYVAIARGDTAEAWAELDESLAVAQSRQATYDVALAFEAMSIAASTTGDRTVDATAARVLLGKLGVLAPPRPPIAVAV